MRLSSLWMQRMHKITKYMRFEDGRIPRKQKRIAYKDAHTGSKHRVHVGLKRNKPKVRVGILGDVSYSTQGFKTQYARAIVLLLASLEKKDDVKAAFAIFNSKFKVLMQFGDRVSRTKIRPQADGGTVLAPLLDEVETWVWDGYENVLIVITDGDIDKFYNVCVPKLLQLAKKHIKIVLVDIVEDESLTFLHGSTVKDVPAWMHVFASTIENLPFKLMDAITNTKNFSDKKAAVK